MTHGTRVSLVNIRDIQDTEVAMAVQTLQFQVDQLNVEVSAMREVLRDHVAPSPRRWWRR